MRRAALVAGAVLALGACSDDDSNNQAASSTTESSTTNGEEDTTSTESNGAGGSADPCDALTTLREGAALVDELAGAGEDQALIAAAAEVRESFVTAFSDLAEAVPEELRDDVSTMRDALVPLLDAAADNDYEQFTEVMEDIAQDGGETVQSASIEVNNYSQEQCGFVLDE